MSFYSFYFSISYIDYYLLHRLPSNQIDRTRSTSMYWAYFFFKKWPEFQGTYQFVGHFKLQKNNYLFYHLVRWAITYLWRFKKMFFWWKFPKFAPQKISWHKFVARVHGNLWRTFTTEIYHGNLPWSFTMVFYHGNLPW